jgi:hypothetical protein
MPHGTRIKGIVIDRTGAPVADATLAVTHGTFAVPEVGIKTNSQGEFAVWLPDGTFRLEGYGPDGSAGKLDVNAPQDDFISLKLGEKPQSE